MSRSICCILCIASLPLAAGLAAAPAFANGLISWTPTVHVTIRGVESQAALGSQLRVQGYSRLVFSAFLPNTATPHPELLPSGTNAPEWTPAHPGWNGVGMRNGETVQIFVDLAGG